MKLRGPCDAFMPELTVPARGPRYCDHSRYELDAHPASNTPKD